MIGVVGRIEQCQVAYVAREPAGETYRRLCHIFRTESPHQVHCTFYFSQSFHFFFLRLLFGFFAFFYFFQIFFWSDISLVKGNERSTKGRKSVDSLYTIKQKKTSIWRRNRGRVRRKGRRKKRWWWWWWRWHWRRGRKPSFLLLCSSFCSSYFFFVLYSSIISEEREGKGKEKRMECITKMIDYLCYIFFLHLLCLQFFSALNSFNFFSN